MSTPTGDPRKGVLSYEDWQASGDATIHGLTFAGFVRALAMRSGRPLPPMLGQLRGEVAAYVNHGRWVADCPAGDGGSLVVSPDELLFWCLVCGNEGNGRQWYGVEFPPARKAIEAALSARGERRNRNWTPRESVQDLRGENDAQVRVPVPVPHEDAAVTDRVLALAEGITKDSTGIWDGGGL